MKSTHVFRNSDRKADSEDSLKRAAKLDPIRKSGKDRHAMFSQLDDEDDPEWLALKKRDSVLDYFDDGEPDEESEQ